ncbi:hypothetical protein N6N71_21750 [Escherichia albertii]|nr:hypothetical protein [Escherichia albertii]MCU7267254.1 hypothetical protein [Escherichia albertii]MCU7268643.1 hypothetical protein [Escherichia albertii]MCU7286661.1 hypothetical protein [Escherichia albertii]MCU7287316.1 hypothetical protein [Escherichia albertii]MCU7311172.1 hypothetical protein [Escherichia albertii]
MRADGKWENIGGMK